MLRPRRWDIPCLQHDEQAVKWYQAQVLPLLLPVTIWFLEGIFCPLWGLKKKKKDFLGFWLGIR